MDEAGSINYDVLSYYNSPPVFNMLIADGSLTVCSAYNNESAYEC